MAVQEVHVCDAPTCQSPGTTYTVMVGERVVKVDLCDRHAGQCTVATVLSWAKPVKPPPRKSRPRTVDHGWLEAVPVFDDGQAQ